MAKDKTTGAEGMEVVETSLSKIEQFIEKNQKILTIALLVIIGIVGIYMGAKKFYYEPMQIESQEQIFAAIQYFEKDSFKLALNGDGNYLGFLDIIDEYGSTKSGNLANYYTGISYLHLGNYEDAIEYLKDFSSGDKMVGTMALAAIGDAYSELNQYEEAVDYYIKASEHKPNDLLTPPILMKAGQLYEEMGKYQEALEIYEKIKKDYSSSDEGSLNNIQKYITRAKIKGNIQ
ncbi:MAG: tetratricopeptide repeat protein [Bacteroidia bacterium]|nr:tetratricopeptide repeat protein [Bacteroidia bacterium]